MCVFFGVIRWYTPIRKTQGYFPYPTYKGGQIFFSEKLAMFFFNAVTC